MNEVVLSIGSNVTPRYERVVDALSKLKGILEDCMASDIYETPEIHGIGRPYMNAVMTGTTNMSLDDLHQRTKQLELQAGRDAEARMRGEVYVDIDIVIWNREVIRPNDFRQTFFKIGAESLGILQPVNYGR